MQLKHQPHIRVQLRPAQSAARGICCAVKCLLQPINLLRVNAGGEHVVMPGDCSYRCSDKHAIEQRLNLRSGARWRNLKSGDAVRLGDYAEIKSAENAV